MRVAVLMLVAAGAARAEDWRQPNAPEIALQVAAEVLIAVDVLQTLDVARQPDRFYEHNLFLGSQPSTERIVLMGSLAGIGAAGLFVALPPRFRWVLPTVLIVAESAVIARNAMVGASIRF